MQIWTLTYFVIKLLFNIFLKKLQTLPVNNMEISVPSPIPTILPVIRKEMIKAKQTQIISNLTLM